MITSLPVLRESRIGPLVRIKVLVLCSLESGSSINECRVFDSTVSMLDKAGKEI